MEQIRDSAISLRGLGMNYGDKQVLKDIDLDVSKGQIVGYIGPNGAGKSTTVKIMLGLVEGYTGEVYVLDQDIKSTGIAYKKRIK